VCKSLRNVFLFGKRVRIDKIKIVLCVGICVNCTLYYNEGKEKQTIKSAHILIKVAHCDGISEELFIRRVVALMKVLWVVVLRWTVIVGLNLKLEWITTHVCGCAI
jgi:hypothetical protein